MWRRTSLDRTSVNGSFFRGDVLKTEASSHFGLCSGFPPSPLDRQPVDVITVKAAVGIRATGIRHWGLFFGQRHALRIGWEQTLGPRGAGYSAVSETRDRFI